MIGQCSARRLVASDAIEQCDGLPVQNRLRAAPLFAAHVARSNQGIDDGLFHRLHGGLEDRVNAD